MIRLLAQSAITLVNIYTSGPNYWPERDASTYGNHNAIYTATVQRHGRIRNHLSPMAHTSYHKVTTRPGRPDEG